jgi:hypothetical protein
MFHISRVTNIVKVKFFTLTDTCQRKIFLISIYHVKVLNFTLKKERRLRFFKNRMLRKFRLKRDEVTGIE